MSTDVKDFLLGATGERSDHLNGQPSARPANAEKPAKNSRSASGKGLAARVPSAMVGTPLSAHHTLDFASKQKIASGKVYGFVG